MPKPLTVWITANWKILKEMRIPDHLTHLMRNLHAGQEATVRTGWRNRLVPNWESEVAQSCPTLCDPWTVAYQASLSRGFSKQGFNIM